MFEKLLNDRRQGFGLVGFGEEAVGFDIGGGKDRFIDGAADHDDFLFWMQTATGANEGEAVHLVHGEIGDDEVRRSLGRGIFLKRDVGIGEGLDAAVEVAQDLFGQFKQDGFIVHHKDERT